MNLKGGVLVANPIPKEDSLDEDFINGIIDRAIEQSVLDHISGKETTPYLLKKIVEETDGKSLEANLSLVYNNAKVGAQLAKAYARLSNE
jgi:pseudouridine-5'-phosphate glycosidase